MKRPLLLLIPLCCVVLAGALFLLRPASGEGEQPALSPAPTADASAQPEDTPAPSQTPEPSLTPAPQSSETPQPDSSALPAESAEPSAQPFPGPTVAPIVQPSQAPQAGGLQTLLNNFFAPYGASWDVRVETLDGSQSASYRTADQSFVSASIIKLYVMATVYHYIDQGILSHDNCYSLLYSMITVSDNTATNSLIRLLGNGDAAAGMAAVNSYAAQLGCTGTQLNRLMLAGNGLENYTTAADCAHILRMIYNGTCVSADWSAEMMAILRDQAVNNRLPAGLPSGTAIAHKTGDLTSLCCADVGIVFSPAGDYIICVICNYPSNDYSAAQGIAALSGEVYSYFNS